ncbi:hypothetical protein GVN20_29165 [Runella sp. CRIBMP]|nr:hypothetical protein [Runella sp. CRIBMP]
MNHYCHVRRHFLSFSAEKAFLLLPLEEYPLSTASPIGYEMNCRGGIRGRDFAVVNPIELRNRIADNLKNSLQKFDTGECLGQSEKLGGEKKISCFALNQF